MTWFAFTTATKKIFIWLKHHWQIPFLAVWTIVTIVLTRRNSEALIEVIEAKRDSYRKQLEILRSSHNDEILKRDKLLEEYHKTVKKIEEDFFDQV